MESGARLKAAVRRVSMAGLFSVSIMVVESGARWPSVPKVLEAGLVSVFVMVVAKDVNTMGVGRVRKAGRIFARHMAAAGGARGNNLAANTQLLVTSLLEGKPVFVLHIVSWLKMTGFLESWWTNLRQGMVTTRYRKAGFMAAV